MVCRTCFTWAITARRASEQQATLWQAEQAGSGLAYPNSCLRVQQKSTLLNRTPLGFSLKGDVCVCVSLLFV